MKLLCKVLWYLVKQKLQQAASSIFESASGFAISNETAFDRVDCVVVIRFITSVPEIHLVEAVRLDVHLLYTALTAEW